MILQNAPQSDISIKKKKAIFYWKLSYNFYKLEFSHKYEKINFMKFDR